ncbi:hypothetical protein CI109_102049 [Kwoniella shandongensis]|uniref:Uncharacterized protein n=1 Tax=Kwoniella shandongensis TaxID=1734106 RepID=A0A5M6BT30_9TREE|nr:uncharacterized protein CI109_006542 [Kwoniella shandongensis]KAA5525172.1 hypothetical protein CI109_006542 [Kwoniella shandongensis]
MAEATIAHSHNPYPVAKSGYLFGSYLALALYGVHCSQVVRYYGNHSDSWRIRLLVLWIWTLSTLQILIILASSWKYFVDGIENTRIWGEFWWPLSVQDGLVPLMAYTAQLYFGRRAWKLTGRRPWLMWSVWILSTIAFLAGLALAVTARIWSDDPFVSYDDFRSRSIGIPSQAVAITWMGLSAFIDGSLTLILVYRFSQARKSVFHSTRSLVKRMIALTLETVLLTHMVGGVMCIIFLASPAAHRTQSDIFWVLLEVVTELYALSVVFTINSRTPTSPPSSANSSTEDKEKSIELEDKDQRELPSTESAIDRHVEGYQGSQPFGVRIFALPRTRNESESGSGSSGGSQQNSSTFGVLSQGGSSLEGTASPRTPADELTGYVLSPRPVGGDGSRRYSDWNEMDEEEEDSKTGSYNSK